VATSFYGTALSDAAAVSEGRFGGRAVSVSDSLADAFGGLATSRVRAVSGASLRGLAIADGVGISVAGRRQHSRADVRAVSHARRWGRSASRVAAIEIRR
jgi:hypothetical protein